MHRLILVVALAANASPLFAQESRFELGQRLRWFERALDRHPAAEARKRALPPLIQATPTFFSGQLGVAAGLLDRARLLLEEETPADEMVWANSLVVKPAWRLLDTSAKDLSVQVESFYPVKIPKPAQASLRLVLLKADNSSVRETRAELKELPATMKLTLTDIPEGDYWLRSETLVAGKVCAAGEQTISLATGLADRLRKLRKGLEGLPPTAPALEKKTCERLLTFLRDLEAGRTLETNYPAARLLQEGESALASAQAGKSFYGPHRAGQFWLQFGSDAVRVQVPPEAAKGKPLPLVVAMHGAGGSDNMFFDGYGDGLVARLCARRGWLLVTTRTSLFGFGGADPVSVVDALAKVYPVDTKRVFLLGHSMGAAQAVAAAGRAPQRFRGVAALGGGGGFRTSEKLKALPFFIGCGERDFALNGAKKLHQGLVRGGVDKAVLRSYPDVEHLIVVQLALPEVFRFFEEALAGK